ncbi:ImmA/IrrE family metallo-endopeptidase [Clostridium beijerinckii]|uniref:Zn-dependent peptidase ImmA (M78 family) n=1 Tax=Clostridium beijerinckii TaxID=1520 RepID=A0AAX0B6Q7_CLOBE|nr:ImmA/IrrE family metallo-endopeptidase [Clostridium beijerinckii]NRT90128.1 Zn-dependent peptidase ImmA (M78 family) [Clostridium beijerinckii]NYC69658.1 Zn-dependent peptidase ImmA (M78 family) [Clostridium beijerinckii]
MVNYRKKVQSLVKKCKTRDPYKIAMEEKVEVKFKHLSPSSPEGIFKKILRRKYIIINLTRITSKPHLNMVLAHELGHAMMHSSDKAFFLHDHTFYDRGRFEIEANKFAAELLIDEEKVDTIYLEDLSIEQLACSYEVSVQLIKYKFTCK